jgi:hypothetical protein
MQSKKVLVLYVHSQLIHTHLERVGNDVAIHVVCYVLSPAYARSCPAELDQTE